jgi:hypothetical protein
MCNSRWILAVGWLGVASAIGAQATTRDSTPPADTGVRTLSSASAGRERARVTFAGGSRSAGWVVSADDTLLVLKPDRRPIEFWYPRPRTYDRRQLARLELSEYPKRRDRAAIVGAVVGTIAGALVGAVVLDKECVAGSLAPCHGREIGIFLGGAVGLGVGGLLGRHVIGRDRWVEIPTVGRPRG